MKELSEANEKIAKLERQLKESETQRVYYEQIQQAMND